MNDISSHTVVEYRDAGGRSELHSNYYIVWYNTYHLEKEEIQV